jgi:hypothetical protein
MLYIPDAIAKVFGKKSRGSKLRDWIYRAQYRSARNAEKRVALAVLQTIVSGSSQIFDQNVTAIFIRARV